MNNEIFIKENFKVDDSHSKVRGFVFAYDENDNLVFAKENMIVRTGRQYIMKYGLSKGFKCAFLSTNADMVTENDALETDIEKNLESIGNEDTRKRTTNSFDFDIAGDNFSIEDISFSNKYFFAEEDTTRTNKLYNVIKNDINYEDYYIEEKNYFSYNINEETLEVQCLIVFNGTDDIEANSLGLIVNDGTDDILFSRVTFPTYYKSASQRLTFKYYIYF